MKTSWQLQRWRESKIIWERACRSSKSPPSSPTEQCATEGASTKSLKDTEAEEVLGKVWVPPMELIVCVQSLANKSLYVAKLKARYGDTMYTYAWKNARIRVYRGGDTCAGHPSQTPARQYRDPTSYKSKKLQILGLRWNFTVRAISALTDKRNNTHLVSFTVCSALRPAPIRMLWCAPQQEVTRAECLLRP